MNFDEAVKRNNLIDLLEAQFGKWGHWTKDAADLVLKVTGGGNPLQSSMLSVTWANESAWNLYPYPQVNCPCKEVWPHDKDICNGNLFNPWGWDSGGLQLNLAWTMRMAWQGEIKTHDTFWVKVFGTTFYEPEEVETVWHGATIKARRPARFNGEPFDHLTVGMRRLLGRKASAKMAEGVQVKDEFIQFTDLAELQVVRYTGPGAQPQRLRSWRKYNQLFQEFFAVYKP